MELGLPRRYGKTNQFIKYWILHGGLMGELTSETRYYNLGVEIGTLDRLEGREHGYSTPLHIVLKEYKDSYWRGYEVGYNPQEDSND